MSGTLYLCGTPIGNLEDITLRVLRLLRECDLIAAEDTRHTRKLLNHFEINTPLTSYHEHNKQTKGLYLIEKLQEGKNIVLVSDAGMPGISDPGEDLVCLCYENDIPITCVPGPVAAITALVLSGLSTRRFLFEGFLPVDKKERRQTLLSLEKEERTIVLYEAPHRLKDTLQELLEVLGNRNAACVRELTKKYEEVKKDTLEGLCGFFKENSPKGEFVLVIEGVSRQVLIQEQREEWEKLSIVEHVSHYISGGMTEKDAMKQAAKDRGVSKREIYAQLKK